jgi:hypothetical protein
MREKYKRQSFLGEGSEAVHANCVAGLVGLGGGGSHIAQQLAHLGIENFHLFDPDRVDESNLNRLVGATPKDAIKSSLKTAVAKRLIKAINPRADVKTINKKWQEGQLQLRGCDVIFGCLDTYRDRSELETIARRYLIPYVDIGMDVHSVAGEFVVTGQVILSMPGELCMRCLGFLRDELLEREAANYGDAGGRPQVVWANGMLASAAVGIYTQLFTPWHRKHEPTFYLEYEGNAQTVTRSNRLECVQARACGHFSAHDGLGDPFGLPAEGRLDPKSGQLSLRG